MAVVRRWCSARMRRRRCKLLDESRFDWCRTSQHLRADGNWL
jgi:hypothetical protein